MKKQIFSLPKLLINVLAVNMSPFIFSPFKFFGLKQIPSGSFSSFDYIFRTIVYPGKGILFSFHFS